MTRELLVPRDHFLYASSQWELALHCNAVTHWLGAYTERSRRADVYNEREEFVLRCGHPVVIKWKHFPRYWPFVRGIHRSPVNSPHKGQWRGALMFSLICVWINDWVNNGEAGDLRRYRAHYDVTVWNSSIVYCKIISRRLFKSYIFHTDCTRLHETPSVNLALNHR